MRKWNSLITIGLFCAILFSFTVVDMLNEDRIFSERERRALAVKPSYSRDTVRNGKYMEQYEKYVTDQFVGRDKWIDIKMMSDLALQKSELNGVYLCDDGYLIEKHAVADFPQELIDQKLDLLEPLVKRWNAKVMLVPTADNILRNRLPAYAEYFDQSRFLEQVNERVGSENMIDVYATLLEHRDEEIYYRTDHHWTTRGAYYGYTSWADAVGVKPIEYDPDQTETVSTNFYGTLYNKVHAPVSPDRIEFFPGTDDLPVQITYDFEKKSDSFYEEKYLQGSNQYAFFMDDNHGIVEIRTSQKNNKTLFVIKDSYANCYIPLMANHYEKIYVIDLRYMNVPLNKLMEQYNPEEGMDVLILYNCIHFLEEFNYR